jgi:3-dehydroquinate synthase
MIVQHSQGSYEISFHSYSIANGITVTDENVAGLYPSQVPSDSIIIPAGESSKNLSTYSFICQELLKRGATRKSQLVALGGGVIGDLVGFVAATYMRGIPFVQVPTTLLAQVDSSVGGKVGIDLPEGKNLVGSFYAPQQVIVDTSFLNTLPERQLQCGLAEVIKYGWIVDPDLLKATNRHDWERFETVSRCIQLKAQVVVEDEFETKGIRVWLNFGHTIGHAIEQLTEYKVHTHGEAISIGMVIETRIAELLGFAEVGLTDQVADSLRFHGLPTKIDPDLSVDSLIRVMRLDKKSDSGELAMSLVQKAGVCQLVKNVPQQVVREALL